MHSVEALSPTDIARELIAMGLRPVNGIDVRRLEAACLELDTEQLDAFSRESLISLAQDRLALTQKGRLLADFVTTRLAP